MWMKKSTEIVLAWELWEQGLSKSTIARQLGRDRETIRIWIAGVEQSGLKGFVCKSRTACQVPHPSRQVVQFDTVHFGWVFAFTAIDIFSREAGYPLGGTCCGRASLRMTAWSS